MGDHDKTMSNTCEEVGKTKSMVQVVAGLEVIFPSFLFLSYPT